MASYTADLVHALDKVQATDAGRVCPNEGKKHKLEHVKVTRTEHGRLQAHASGTVLICGLCGYNEPASNPLG